MGTQTLQCVPEWLKQFFDPSIKLYSNNFTRGCIRRSVSSLNWHFVPETDLLTLQCVSGLHNDCYYFLSYFLIKFVFCWSYHRSTDRISRINKVVSILKSLISFYLVKAHQYTTTSLRKVLQLTRLTHSCYHPVYSLMTAYSCYHDVSQPHALIGKIIFANDSTFDTKDATHFRNLQCMISSLLSSSINHYK